MNFNDRIVTKANILDILKKHAILLLVCYDSNLKIELNVNKKDKVCKINITEYL